jgi:CubicO group peptidase (beta-lactamase class C family)
MKRLNTLARVLGTLTLAAASLSGIGAVVPTSSPDDSIEDFIDSVMPASAAPGISYAVVSDGEITSAGARGVVKIGTDTAVTPDTPFVIGSISKSFTALAVMQLVEAGKVELDTEVSNYLDEFAGKPAGAITIRQLLSHTSGYSTTQGNAGHPDSTGDTDDLARDVDRLADVTPANSPNAKWEYSNANFEILGRLIEVVSGDDYQSYVTTNILKPVGMDHSFVADGEIHTSMATGHVPWFGTKLPLDTGTTDRATAPQGGIIASASDLALYLQMMLNGKDDVLSADGKALMMRPASEVSPGYGFGWFVAADPGVVWHSGVSPGVETLATLIPAEHKAVIVLVNGGSGMGIGESDQLRVGISDLALGLSSYDAGGTTGRLALFLGLALLPIFYLLSMVWAWLRRTKIRAKRSSVSGQFSLWFPLLTTLAAAWVLLGLAPMLNGTPLAHWAIFQPDVVLVFVASAVTGVLWSGFRLVVAFTGKTRPA